MKSSELEIMNLLNSNGVFKEGKIKEYPKKYSRFDAFNKRCIVEIKDRENKNNYNDLMIEFDKYAYNKEFAIHNNVRFYYSNRYKDNIYTFDILNLCECKYDFKWRWEMHAQTTEFGKSKEKIPKYVGYIDLDCAWDVLPMANDLLDLQVDSQVVKNGLLNCQENLKTLPATDP